MNTSAAQLQKEVSSIDGDGTNIVLLRTAQLFLASEKKERGGRLISLEPAVRPRAAFFRGRDSGAHGPAGAQ